MTSLIRSAHDVTDLKCTAPHCIALHWTLQRPNLFYIILFYSVLPDSTILLRTNSPTHAHYTAGSGNAPHLRRASNWRCRTSVSCCTRYRPCSAGRGRWHWGTIFYFSHLIYSYSTTLFLTWLESIDMTFWHIYCNTSLSNFSSSTLLISLNSFLLSECLTFLFYVNLITKMSLRTFDHLLHYGELPVKRVVPLALALLYVSNPDYSVIDQLSRLSHDQVSTVTVILCEGSKGIVIWLLTSIWCRKSRKERRVNKRRKQKIEYFILDPVCDLNWL